MRLEELRKLDICPEWLKAPDIKVDNEDIAVIGGEVVWRGGTWHIGTWCGGKWYGGKWYDGVWHIGTWYGGKWYGGKWYDGVWYGGKWYGGDWRGGRWFGDDWYGGKWYGGKWRGGKWYEGVWYGGKWYGGDWYGGDWYVGLIRVPSRIHSVWLHPSSSLLEIGCRAKTIPEWDHFFYVSDEVYETERSNPNFRRIIEDYEDAKAEMLVWRKRLLGDEKCTSIEQNSSGSSTATLSRQY